MMARFNQLRPARRGRAERWKEFAIAVAASLGMAWVALVSYQQMQFDNELAIATVSRTNQARVQGFQQFVLRTIEAADLATRQVERDLTELKGDRSYLARDPILQSPVFDGLVVRLSGSKHIQANEQPLPEHVLDRLDDLAANAKADLVIAPPINIGNGKWKIAAIRNFANHGGYVAVIMDPNRFTDFAQSIPFGKDDLISLIGLDGVTRARRTGNVLSAGEPVRGLVMERQLANPNGTYVGPSVLDGIPRIFSHRRLTKFGLFATSGTPLATVHNRVAERRRFQLFATIAGMAFIAGAGIAIVLANRRNYRRLIDLEGTNHRLEEAQRIGAIGDWDYYPESDELFWSDNLNTMYGRHPEERVSSLSDVARHVSPEDTDKIQKQVAHVLEKGETGTWEVNAILADGSRSNRRVIAVPIHDETGRIIGIHGTDQDITHLVQARNLERRLTEVARLESVNSLAATLAHELNQPLGITANYLGAAQRMLDEGGCKGKVLEYLSASQEQLQHLAAIISGARDLVSPGQLDADEVDLAEATETVLALLRGHLGRRAFNYSLDISGNLTTIWSNRAQLKQVLFNLAKNSVEAVPEEREPMLSFKVRRVTGSGQVRIDLSDNGTGIADVQDPFAALNTTKSTGLGLGLSLARTIVEAHGGKIWVETTGPTGTTISFTLREGR